LVALIAGKAATAMESLAGDQVVHKAMDPLKKIFTSPPNPVRAVVTRWASDIFAFGSYSYMTEGTSGEEYDALAKPIRSKVFFAGEATHKYHPATVNGAMMSGFQAAFDVVDSFHKKIEPNAQSVPPKTLDQQLPSFKEGEVIRV